MPPYASSEHNHSSIFDVDTAHDLSLVEIPLGPKPDEVIIEASDDSLLDPIGEEDNPKPSIFERLLDCNPCVMKIANPSSALFKVRTCIECGEKVHKLRGGYEKQARLDKIVDDKTGEESVVEIKKYYHNTCFQLLEDRMSHKDAGFGAVVIELEDFFEARVRRKGEEEERRARRSRTATKTASVSARDAPLEDSQKKWPLGFVKRARRALKSFSWSACRGKQDITEASAFTAVEI